MHATNRRRRRSAGELRQRYSNKPSAQRLDDSQLSASQLRARHEVENRQFKEGGSSTMIIVGVVIAALVVGFVLFGQ